MLRHNFVLYFEIVKAYEKITLMSVYPPPQIVNETEERAITVPYIYI
jgi:hypothetical protein